MAFVVALVLLVACGGALPSVGASPAADGAEAHRPTAVTPAPSAVPVPTTEAALGFAPTGETVDAELVRVTDGDTIRVRIDGEEFRVRYIGIDTPEVDDSRADVRKLADAATRPTRRSSTVAGSAWSAMSRRPTSTAACCATYGSPTTRRPRVGCWSTSSSSAAGSPTPRPTRRM